MRKRRLPKLVSDFVKQIRSNVLLIAMHCYQEIFVTTVTTTTTSILVLMLRMIPLKSVSMKSPTNIGARHSPILDHTNICFSQMIFVTTIITTTTSTLVLMSKRMLRTLVVTTATTTSTSTLVLRLRRMLKMLASITATTTTSTPVTTASTSTESMLTIVFSSAFRNNVGNPLCAHPRLR